MSDMVSVNLREFQRDFSRLRKLAKKGATIEILSQDGSKYVFRLRRRKNPLLGCMRGQHFPADVTSSTGERWEAEDE